MSFKKAAVAAALALSMTAAPVMAQSAAPLSVATAVNGSNRADQNRLFGLGDYAIPVAVFVAVIVAIILLNKGNDRNLPASG
jgi:hypothetical protein